MVDCVNLGTCQGCLLESLWSFLKTKSGLLVLVLFQHAELKVQGTFGSHRSAETQAIRGPPSGLYMPGSGASGTEDRAILL